jgi:hypothetical protein
MKRIILNSVLALGLLSLVGCTSYMPSKKADMKVSFADSKWDGVTVPKNEVCKWAGGNGATPTLKVSNLPNGTSKVLVLFSDFTYKPMDNGGHGQIGINVSNETNIIIPSIKGETKIMPSNMFISKEHKGLKRGKAGAYLPPCSGGRGNSYYATIKALNSNDEVLKSQDIQMGKF